MQFKFAKYSHVGCTLENATVFPVRGFDRPKQATSTVYVRRAEAERLMAVVASTEKPQLLIKAIHFRPSHGHKISLVPTGSNHGGEESTTTTKKGAKKGQFFGKRGKKRYSCNLNAGKDKKTSEARHRYNEAAYPQCIKFKVLQCKREMKQMARTKVILSFCPEIKDNTNH
eukprot:CCRYP_000991-RA/>CCRYP_000991-RA protein AED:0.57 eAED:0.92 QI:0/0/0/1/0/0/2/0/170